jgi:hypothetical protein
VRRTVERSSRGRRRGAPPEPPREAAAPAVDRSLTSTAEALAALLASMRRSGLEAATKPYDRMQHVLVQQRLWSRNQGRDDLDPHFAAIAANARAVQRILTGFAGAIEQLTEIDRIEPSGHPPAPAASSAALAELLLERRTVSAARLAALDWPEEDRRRFLAGLVAAGVLERTGWGRSLGYRLSEPTRRAAAAAVGRVLRP